MDTDKTPGRRPNRLDASLYSSASRPYFLTVCAEKSAPHFASPSLSSRIIACLLEEAHSCGILILAYCLMPDHLHILCAPLADGNSVIRFMHAVKGKSTRIGWEYGMGGKLWQKGYYDHIVRRDEGLQKIVDYIQANPVRKGLVEDCTAYRFNGTPDPFPDWW